jgi:hypothetical protein
MYHLLYTVYDVKYAMPYNDYSFDDRRRMNYEYNVCRTIRILMMMMMTFSKVFLDKARYYLTNFDSDDIDAIAYSVCCKICNDDTMIPFYLIVQYHFVPHTKRKERKEFVPWSPPPTSLSLFIGWTQFPFSAGLERHTGQSKMRKRFRKKGNHVYIFDDHKHMNLVPLCTAIELLSKKFRLCPKKPFSSSSSYVLHQKCNH